jgi:hypothetical protein
MTRTQALHLGSLYTSLGNPIGMAEVDRTNVNRPDVRLR